ncbi:LacI family DNA-binding transcriptional regulator [Alkalihalobacillus hemicellulosilyticus]|uniref:Ribose operon repressor n=1 Tax=Halalkalibacter hemicellulosilyticusJCM 9152 TaxID=1236971 RepID=W4Q9X6_9BACI|nr:LacI family DNA-binding transcriptional regulator [Halalkalibacter hemicellulosilyticus]GAE28787.1 ribose operon repressor [Halalkalibacter hemicellulosilyticusJCM 9152]
MASIKDVAKVAKVSTATVSHVINGTRYVANETKDKVFLAMKELDYKPNLVAKSLRSRKSMIIGLIVPMQYTDTSNFFFMSIANGIETIVKQQGYNLILGNSHENIQTEIEQIKLFNSQLIDGLIIAPTADNMEPYLEHFNGEYPVVFIDRKPVGYNGDLVIADSYNSTLEAITLLMKKGHKKIGFITGKLGISTSDERLTAYKKAYEQNDLPIDTLCIKEGESCFDSGYKFAEELVENQKITAIFVANNVMTMGALRYLNENHLKVPDDVAIIGFDDYDWMKITSPPISVIKQPSFEMGEEAVRILLERIENGKEYEGEQVLLPSEFISRKSV